MNSASKNVYIDKLDDLVNKYNDTYHGTIKMEPVDVKPKKLIIRILNLKLVILLEYQYIKTFLQKAVFQIGQKKLLSLKKLKILRRGHILLMNLTGKKLLEYSTRKNSKKQIKKNLELKK